MTGFLAGAAIDVVIGELSKLTGTDSSGDNAWRELYTWVKGLGDIHWWTVAVGAASLGVILALRFTVPKIPGALVLVVGGLVASGLFDLGAHGVALVGHVPRGLPEPELPGYDVFRDHIAAIALSSVALLLIGFSQTAGDARAFATRHRYRIDIDQESVAQGMANVGAGVFQGMPVSTSLSASSLNEAAGASTPVASLITGGLVLLTLVVLAPLFAHLPKAVLAAVIIDAVVFGMIDLAELRRLRVVARFDFWIAIAAIVGVLSAGVLAGVAIGVVLSLGWLIYVTATPRMPELGQEPGTQRYRELDLYPDDVTHPGHRRAPPRQRPLLRDRRGARQPRPRRDPRRRRRARGDPRPRRRRVRRLAGRGEAGRAEQDRRDRGSRASARAGQAGGRGHPGRRRAPRHGRRGSHPPECLPCSGRPTRARYGGNRFG